MRQLVVNLKFLVRCAIARGSCWGVANHLNTTLKQRGRLDKMIVLRMLNIGVILICVSHGVLCQELRRPIFLGSGFGLTHIWRVDFDCAQNGQRGAQCDEFF